MKRVLRVLAAILLSVVPVFGLLFESNNAYAVADVYCMHKPGATNQYQFTSYNSSGQGVDKTSCSGLKTASDVKSVGQVSSSDGKYFHFTITYTDNTTVEVGASDSSRISNARSVIYEDFVYNVHAVSTKTYYESETNQQYSRSCVQTKYSDGSYTYVIYKPQAAGSSGFPVDSGNGKCPSSFSHSENTGGSNGGQGSNNNGGSGNNGSNNAGGGGSNGNVSVTTGVVSHGSGGSAGKCHAGDTTITFAILPIEGDNVDCKDAIFQALGIGLSILTWGVSIGATIGFVITAYQYITAGSNVAQVQKAKMRMVQIVIGIVFYATFWGVMNWLLPGGLFGDGSL